MSVRASNATWLAPGSRLDRYDLLLQVAEGGMGLLWLAMQQGKHGFDKIVAIKTILPRLASDGGFRQMFLDEARVVSRIEHPNVAQVLDLGEERGVLFMVMEWIDGESLTNLARTVGRNAGAQIPVGILTRVMVDVCAGLHAAHELTDDGISLGVVHRDVSPHNLLIGFRGTTKVIDFGIAKARNRMAQDTSVGLLKGKIAYMSPEQAMGQLVDRRADVWSAGASMYRYLAGCVPYNAAEPVAVLRQIAEGLPPPPLPLTVPEPIRLVVEKALEPDPDKRFETARGMGIALETAMRAADIQTTRDDVAAFMTEHLGKARTVRNREIEGAARESRARMRVGVAHAENASERGVPNAQKDPIHGSPAPSAESWDESFSPGGVSDEPLRPSARPTAAMSCPEGSFRPSGRPTVVTPGLEPSPGLGPIIPTAADVPFGAFEVPQTGLHEAVDSARRNAATSIRSAPSASIWVPIGLQRRASRSLTRWTIGTGLLGLLLVSGFAWRAAQPSRPSDPFGAASSPTALPKPAETWMLPLVARPAVLVTAATPDPLAPMPAPAHPNDQRVSATRPVESSGPDRGSADDLLERARRARRAGRIDEAAALFAAAVEKAPANSEALTGLAEVEEAQGATAQAIVTYRRAVTVNPKYLPAHLGLADSLWTSGHRVEARTTYRNILDQFPPSMCPDLVRTRARP